MNPRMRAWIGALALVALGFALCVPSPGAQDARALLEAGKYAEAEAAFQKRLEAAPGDLDAGLGLAESRLWLGKFAEAEGVVNGILQAAPKERRALWLLARISFQHAEELRGSEIPTSLSIRTRYTDAEEICTKILRSDPTDVDALKLRGDARFWLENLEGAAADYAAALEKVPDDAGLNASLGELYVRYLNRPADGIPFLEKAASLDPKLVGARRNLGHAYRATGSVDRAVEQYLAVLKLDPEDAETYGALWDLYAAQERFDDASALYDRILKGQPGSPMALWHQAHLLNLQGKYPEAMEKCTRILEERPQWNAVRDFLAGLAMNLEKRDEAVGLWKEVLDRDPANEGALAGLLGLARGDGEAGRYEQALALFDELVRRKPEDAAVRADRALTLWNLGRVDDAIQAYEDALGVDPYDSQIMNDLGLAYQGKGDYQKAIEYFMKAIDVDNNLDSQENYAVIIMKFGETARASNMFLKVLALDGHRDRSLKYYLECRRKLDLERKIKMEKK